MGDFSIQISSNLVNSLTASEDKPNEKTKRTKTKQPQKLQSQRPQTKPNQSQSQTQISDDFELHKAQSSTGWPLQQPVFFPAPPSQPPSVAELEAIRSVLQESVRVVEKLEKQEEDMIRSVTQRAKELRDKEFKLPYQKPLPCVAENEACLECYQEHVKEPLKCADLVRSFADCARRVRQQVSSVQ